ncbi:uncharacterized protein N7496_000854 [Penicillium cataractarum]|uniref:Zn(2)-C6 fungal-type domain-containing protein n=1 Tax=Penicillium cataractarum TaxID=2100454 RepID=A0A9W9VUV3_9EURO|nr:uncharacterized protein N7496_000854 [Penicillium cataractarum]KAJ5389786.1 hypothetical protein N7496_000854 [Penicillium cataractarum]
MKPTKKRRILSCEPCRARKARCTRDGRPCKQCRDRDISASDCIYLGQARKDTIHTELLAKIQRLESCLWERTGTQLSNVSDRTIPSLSTLMASGGFPEATVNEYLGDSTLDNAGSLQKSSTGSVRYFSPASWESIVANSPAAEWLQSFGLDTAGEDDPQIPLVSNADISHAELLGLLPPKPYCDSLTKTYFQNITPTFEAEYQQFCYDPGRMPMSWLALLFAILAISISALNDDNPLLFDLGRERTVGRNIKILFTRYRSAALRCLALDNVMSRHSMTSLQALVLIIYACLNRALPCWTLLGLTHHVAISMACHIDPERFNLGIVECEERRRVWAGLMILYTLQNTLFGNLNQQITTQEVKLPAEVDDVDILTGINTHLLSDKCSSPYTAHLTQMTYMCLACHLHRTANLVSEYISSYTSPRSLTSTLEAEINALRERCDARYTQDRSQEPSPTYHFANKNILHAQIQQQLLLLHRPALIRFLRGEINPETRAAREKCIASANEALSLFGDLLEDPQCIPYRWYMSGLGSFYAFHAVVVLAVLLYHSESTAELESTKEAISKGLNKFTSLSGRSIFCSKAIPTMRQFINLAPASLTHLRHEEQQSQQSPKLQSQVPLQNREFTFVSHCAPCVPMANSSMVNSMMNPQYEFFMPTVLSSMSSLSTNSNFELQLHEQNLPNEVNQTMYFH